MSCYLVSVDASGHGPGGHDVVHHPLTEAFGDLVEFEEVSHAVEHLVVAVGVGIHLLEDGGDITEDGGIQQCCKKHKKNKLLVQLFFLILNTNISLPLLYK